MKGSGWNGWNGRARFIRAGERVRDGAGGGVARGGLTGPAPRNALINRVCNYNRVLMNGRAKKQGGGVGGQGVGCPVFFPPCFSPVLMKRRFPPGQKKRFFLTGNLLFQKTCFRPPNKGLFSPSKRGRPLDVIKHGSTKAAPAW